MNAATKRKPATLSREKLRRAVGHALGGKEFDLHLHESALGGMKVVRVVTPAWKKLRPAERIGRVREAVENTLSAREQKSILRFSVLTPAEYRTLIIDPKRGGANGPHTAAKRMARKAPVRKSKAAVKK
jgi:hypothetical protein